MAETKIPEINPEGNLATRISTAKNRLYFAAAPILAVVIAACAGDRDRPQTVGDWLTQHPEEPKATATIASPTPEIASTRAKLKFDEKVANEQKQELSKMVQIAESWYAKYGVNLNDVNIFAYGDSNKLVEEYIRRHQGQMAPGEEQAKRMHANDHIVFVSSKKPDMYVFLGNRGWTGSSPILDDPTGAIRPGQYHNIIHEFMHLYQQSVGAYKYEPLPHWLNEGAAHYMAAWGLQENDIYNFNRIRNGHIKGAATVPETIIELETLKFYQAGRQGVSDEYSLAFLATWLLTTGKPDHGIGAILSYWAEVGRGKPYGEAFEAAFGISRENFNKRFEAHRNRGFR